MSTAFGTIANMLNTNAQAFEKATQGVPADLLPSSRVRQG